MRGVLDFVLPGSEFSSMKNHCVRGQQSGQSPAKNIIGSSNSKNIDFRHYFLR